MFHNLYMSPDNSFYMLLCTVYILVGLAFTSTIIELVRWASGSWHTLGPQAAVRGELEPDSGAEGADPGPSPVTCHLSPVTCNL
jgi:hypothetical protein